MKTNQERNNTTKLPQIEKQLGNKKNNKKNLEYPESYLAWGTDSDQKENPTKKSIENPIINNGENHE